MNNNQKPNKKDKSDNTGFMWAYLNCSELLKKMFKNNKIDKSLKNEEGLIGYDIVKREN